MAFKKTGDATSLGLLKVQAALEASQDQEKAVDEKRIQKLIAEAEATPDGILVHDYEVIFPASK